LYFPYAGVDFCLLSSVFRLYSQYGYYVGTYWVPYHSHSTNTLRVVLYNRYECLRRSLVHTHSYACTVIPPLYIRTGELSSLSLERVYKALRYSLQHVFVIHTYACMYKAQAARPVECIENQNTVLYVQSTRVPVPVLVITRYYVAPEIKQKFLRTTTTSTVVQLFTRIA